ncbi:MAG: phosphate ABC transporter permease PstA [Pirellulales bacterium]|jgi:phosphate transport system permease protein
MHSDTFARSQRPRRRVRSGYTNLVAYGEPWVWLTAGSLATAVLMITGLLLFIAIRGLTTFWPLPLEQVRLANDQILLGEVAAREAVPDGEVGTPAATRRLIRGANYEFTGQHYTWVDDADVVAIERPEWATAVERLEDGRFHGIPQAFFIDGEAVAEGPAATWARFAEVHPLVRARYAQARSIDKYDRGRVQRELRAARLSVVQAELDHGADSSERAAAVAEEVALQQTADDDVRRFDEQTAALREENARYEISFRTADGFDARMPLAGIVRGWQPNRLSWFGKLSVYLARWQEFLTDDPREANSAGGVFPAIWGTVAMTIIMAVFVAPFGVLAALYLREYASSGPVTSAVRIAINNLAGVPSIVYGAFGLGFFCYVLGANIDDLFFEASLVADNQPVFGTGGLLWASLTLALLTLPVVIVATEEALASVPNSMREGSYACGAGKWQTIRRIVLPRALPGIMTGLILAMARGAGEVAPLMLVGVKKLASDLPIDGVFPYIHPEREFMHLAYLIYDVGFQSPNSQAAQPMVFTITFLLVAIIAALNIAAIWLRGRLRRRFETQQF